MAKQSTQAQVEPDSAGLNWADDIPVLTDVVEDELSLDKALTPEAREIAVKVAARLNIEMRKTGGEQLDIKTIMRLQSLLKEALEPKD